ncbi:hypothetical protein ELH77_19120 [Rhizobium ruizarguesonis]|uniref:hypothetical protein n=1 Tax=Rhizobium ruizarguesonis TaxID=2081791 RepID=UPI0010308B6B|nr:hypothetical protein [Rhizobium ruizarguesonis]TAZ20718.1 hypothetical protein ELH77_19120 [Rhizobium ruizarguesonis]
MDNLDSDTYLIWSNEHGAWWGPGGGRYVSQISEAGHYNRERALEICAQALPGWRWAPTVPELPVRYADAVEMVRRFAESHPGMFPEMNPL